MEFQVEKMKLHTYIQLHSNRNFYKIKKILTFNFNLQIPQKEYY